MKWAPILPHCLLFLFIPVSSNPNDPLTVCQTLMTASSKDFLYSYELDHDGCTLRCVILYPSNPVKYKEYLDATKIKSYFFDNISCGSEHVCFKGACRPKTTPSTTPKPLEVTSLGRVIVQIKRAHFAASDTCGREVCNVRVQFRIGSRTFSTQVIKSNRPEWNEEINVDLDVKSNDSIHFSVIDGYKKMFKKGKLIGNFSINLQNLIEERKSGQPVTYEFNKSPSYVEVVVTWNNKFDHGYFMFYLGVSKLEE